MRGGLRWLSAGLGAAAGAYGAYVAVTWLRYGRPSRPRPEQLDPHLDRFIPYYDIAERHHIEIDAPAHTTLAVAGEIDLMEAPLARAIFRARAALLGTVPDIEVRPRGLLAFTKSLGWGVLADEPGRELVMGAVTRPWEANVVFTPLPPADFASFDEPGYVKIVWTLRADPLGPTTSVFRTETRAVATDAIARARFRRYWSLVSPGIIIIRWALLQPLKAEAERRARAGSTAARASVT
jgi:hypothetical protein